MKTTLLASTLAIAAAISFSSCKKTASRLPDGVYSGTLTIDHSYPVFRDVELNLSGDRYRCTSRGAMFHGGGEGTYSVKDGHMIFSDENAWTADFEWEMILDGVYDYTLSGNKLTITADKAHHYEYRLERK